MKKTYEATITLDKKMVKRYNRLLAIDNFENLSDKEMAKLGAKKDYFEGGFQVDFEDGSYLTYDLCSGSSNYWDEMNWYKDKETNCPVTLDCYFSLGDFIKFEIDDATYLIHIIVK